MTSCAHVLLFVAIVVLSPHLLLTFKSSSCPDDWVDCGNGKCVNHLWRCDGDNDCGNLKDEENCESSIPPKACLIGQFQCVADRYHCIPQTWHCDGENDCEDSSDEFNCESDTQCNGFRCKDRHCIPEKCKCDGRIDCPDKSDEEGCPKGVSVIHLPCSDEGLCSQQCTNISGSYSCFCVDGYEMVNNTCHALGPEPLLVYATLPEIRGIYLRSKKNVFIRKAYSNANAVTVDPLESRVYWSEILNKSVSSVYSSKIDGHSFGAILTNGLVTVEGIAVDYLGRNLYITDSGLRQILACKLDGSMCHVLHQTDIEKPRGIALDPTKGFVYWSDWSDDYVGIYRSGMDGSSRIRMVSENVVWPNGIAIDHTANRLYWGDGKLKTIEYITLDGNTRKVIFKSSRNEYFHPFALTTFEDNLYWSDWVTFSVDSYNRTTNMKMKIQQNELRQYIMGVYVHHPVLAINASNPCLSNSCSHMCLIAPMGNFSCACPSGFKLSDDGKTCTGDTGCSVKNGGCSHLCQSFSGGHSCACPTGMVLLKDGITCTERNCTADEFQCIGEKKCIPHELVCDGIKDCKDGSDEKCEQPGCPGNDFRCKNGRCILSSWKCDRRDDCGDNSDEDECPALKSCAKDQFTCGDGACIQKLWRCDGENDCSDNTDEADCHSTSCDPATELRCKNGQCIPVSWACDGTPDCIDNTDEMICKLR